MTIWFCESYENNEYNSCLVFHPFDWFDASTSTKISSLKDLSIEVKDLARKVFGPHKDIHITAIQSNVGSVVHLTKI